MIDPWHIPVSHHALERYAERRGWAIQHPQAWADVELALRNVLARCAHQNPPLRVRGERAGRIYRHGELVFVVSAGNDAVVTCYPASRRPQDRRKRAKKVHAAARRRALA